MYLKRLYLILNFGVILKIRKEVVDKDNFEKPKIN